MLPTIISNVSALRFDHPWFDPDRRYSVPCLWGTFGLAYDSAQIHDGPLEESWKEYFEPRPELVGKVIATPESTDQFWTAALYLGIDPCTEDPAAAARILELLLAQKAKVAFYGQNDGSERWAKMVIDLDRQGKVALAHVYDADARVFRDNFLPTLAWIVPREGAMLWQTALAVPYGAFHRDNARIFLDWLMAPRNIAAYSNAIRGTNAIAGSEAYLDPELARDQVAALTPDRIRRFRERRACSPAAQELMRRVWAKIWPISIR